MPPEAARDRIIIERILPEIDCGRYPAKSEVGEAFQVSADIFMDGHDELRATLLYRAESDPEDQWSEVPMQHVGNDRWVGAFRLTENTRYRYTVMAWEDVFGSWRRDTYKKIDAGVDVSLEMKEGLLIVESILDGKQAPDAKLVANLRKRLATISSKALQKELLDDDLMRLVHDHDPRAHVTVYDNELIVIADRARARFGAWYEFFPRSAGTDPKQSATFKEAESRLPDIKAMGFDVVYLTPIHPIGEKHRKGKNNAVTAQKGEPGSPYAIKDHKAVHPELGTLKDFQHFVAETKKLGMEVALDFAIQCAPDHPWVTEHPEWFVTRPDGTIKYAENPPKKYQDIVNVDFFSPAWESLWQELRSVVLFWCESGVRIFRVDNPHTKAFAFWEWMIASVQEQYPETIFLAEAFTRPKVMYSLAKLGFTQSYTYFTWRNTKVELTEYLTELSTPEPRFFFRPNFFANTPDILPTYLQTSGKPGFIVRAALAGLLSPTYGLYSGYEFCEDQPIPGKEEYWNSEKYEFKVRDWNAPGNIKDFITRLNRIRNENPALHHLTGLRFHTAQNDNILFFSKSTPDRSNIVFTVINLDPHATQQAWIEMPLAEFSIDEYRPYLLEDVLDGHRWEWTGRTHFQHLEPGRNPVAIFRLTKV